MISSLSSTCRRRRALRAALVMLVAVTGCQGPMRTWRRDDPSLRDLVVTPHPWDEPTGLERSSSHDPASSRSRTAKTKSGRANPYSPPASTGQRPLYEPTDDVAAVGDEEPTFEVEDAEFKSLISQAEPAHRAMLVQIYQAMQARRQEAGQDEPTDDRDTIAYASAEEPVDPQPLSQSRSKSKSAAKQKRPANEVLGATRYAFSDHDSQVQPASATRAIDAGDLGNQPATERNEKVHFQLSDDSQDYATETLPPTNPSSRGTTKGPAGKASAKPQEMKPPAKSRAQRPTVQQPVADTGYEEPLHNIPAPRGPREDVNPVSSRKPLPPQNSTAKYYEEVDSHYTDSSQVVQASAVSSSSAEPSVQPATLRPSARPSSDNSATSAAAPTSMERSMAEPKTDEVNTENWRELALKTLQAVDREPVENNDNAQLNHHMTKRILFVLLGQLDQALEPIPNLKSHEQEYFRHNLTALHNSIDPRGNPVLARRWPLVLEDQRIAMSHLGAVSNLEVKNAAFCSHVDGFGSITKFPTNQFRPNQELLLYCEVDNFVSVKLKDGYETKLRGNYEIVDANQTRVADFILPEEADFCKSMRRDYFFVYRIYTPPNIAPGRYQLRLTIEDMKGNKFGQTSLDMQISSQ